MILALDCATRTGWCLWDNGKVFESGVQDFSKKRGKSNGVMFLRFKKWLNGLLLDYKPIVVVYEQATNYHMPIFYSVESLIKNYKA